MENLYKALDEVISCIKDSDEYQDCLSLKRQMSLNSEVVLLINEVKNLQKEYIRSQYDATIKEKLDSLNGKLMEIPIYVIYLKKLESVNLKIEYVKDSLNDYFSTLFNEKY